MELTEKGNSYLMLQMENGNSKLQFTVFAAYKNRKQKFVFLGWQTINRYQRVQFQQRAYLQYDESHKT
jgi:hypothetical protein